MFTIRGDGVCHLDKFWRSQKIEKVKEGVERIVFGGTSGRI